MAFRVLYISSVLPARSETFVYREILALRKLGVDVVTASVNPNDLDLGSPILLQLARDTFQLYSLGAFGILRSAVAEFRVSPRGVGRVLRTCILDSLSEANATAARRLKIVFQGVAAVALSSWCRIHGVNHIHAHMAHVPTTIAMYAARALSITFSFTGHANDLFPNRTLLRPKLQRCAFVACISHWHRRFYMTIVDRSRRDFPIVRCGVDTDEVTPPSERNSGRFTILGVGRLVEKKGFDILVRAAKAVASRCAEPIQLTIAGDGPERGKLLALAYDVPINLTIEFPGAVTNEQVLSLMRTADVFVLPARIATGGDRDGIPVVLMEAMATGCAVVAGNIATFAELIRHRESGLLVDGKHVSAVAAAIEELRDDNCLRASIGAAGRAKVVSEFDLMDNSRKLCRAFREYPLEAGRSL